MGTFQSSTVHSCMPDVFQFKYFTNCLRAPASGVIMLQQESYRCQAGSPTGQATDAGNSCHTDKLLSQIHVVDEYAHQPTKPPAAPLRTTRAFQLSLSLVALRLLVWSTQDLQRSSQRLSSSYPLRC